MDQNLDEMLSRINHLTNGGDPGSLNEPPTPGQAAPPTPGQSAPQTGVPSGVRANLPMGATNQRPPMPPQPGMPMNPIVAPPQPGASGNVVGAPPMPNTAAGGIRRQGQAVPPNPNLAMSNRPTPGQPMAQPTQAAGIPGQPMPTTEPPGIMRVNQPRPQQPVSPTPMPMSSAPGPTATSQPPGGSPAQPMPAAMAPVHAQAVQGAPAFMPAEPRSLAEAKLNASQLEELVMKYLLARSEDSGKGISDQVKVPFPIVQELLARMKYEQMIFFKDTAHMGDYICSLTERGRERARGFANDCTYFGSAPVALPDYCASVAAQSLNHQTPNEEHLRHAFSDLLVNPKMFLKLGAAMNSGRGMFLFGFPGNGKTSIAERVTKAFGEHIWIPRSIGIDGDIIRVFDPSQHTEAPLEDDDSIVANHKVDKRWVRIERPTLIVGGELTMDNLELSINRDTGINEAPIQLKSNCGTLVIDDFGRQRMTTDELLNRWIVPLEKRYDFLNLPSGKKIQVPFDQLVIFSTNLEPKDLVDDAFLRRIPYKIEVENPSESEFRELFKIMCPIMGFTHDQASIDYLIAEHYAKVDRPFRCCQPRDLLLQVKNYCKYTRKPMALTNDNFDFAAENYFSVM